MRFVTIGEVEGRPAFIFETGSDEKPPNPIIKTEDGCLCVSEKRIGRWYKFHPRARIARDIVQEMVKQGEYEVICKVGGDMYAKTIELTDVEIDSLSRL